jgi:hypothetical protein
VFVISKKNYLLTAAIGVLSLLSLAFAVGSTWEIYILDSKFSVRFSRPSFSSDSG